MQILAEYRASLVQFMGVPNNLITLLFCTAMLLAGGCRVPPRQPVLRELPPIDAPRELLKVSFLDYTIEPPDVLLIDAVSVVPKGLHRIAPSDVLQIRALPAFPDYPIDGTYVVEGAGIVNLGPVYGSVNVNGKSLEEAAVEIEQQLRTLIDNPKVTVSLFQSAAAQRIAGEHLVYNDGTVNLGIHGRVHISGQTIDEATKTIESHLSHFLQDPKVAINVIGFNSKVYYIITEGAGLNDAVIRVPITGNETVLDAISQIEGLSRVSSKDIWIARPAPDYADNNQVLRVDWVAISKYGETATNYQILPGDRVFIAENGWDKAENEIARVLAPVGSNVYSCLVD